MDDDQQFCLRWNNHQSTLVAVFDTLLENGTLVDCTLAAEGKFLNAHKVVLSACSPYFESLLSRHFDKHPILILKDVKFQELKAMMDYMYRGEVNISQDQLGALLKAAESLQIKGLSDNRKGETERKPTPAPPPPKSPQQTSALPKVQGLTIEQRSRDDSREGSLSPGPRKKKRLRRKSEELDNHDASNSSESHSLPAQNIPSSLPAVSKINADVPEPVETKSEILRHKQPDDIPQVPIIKEKIETHTELMLEPKSEYVEEMNEDSIEDLTLDDDDLSNMEQMEDQAGPSHGNAGEGSSQGFGGWHMGNQSQDEVFLAAQEAVGAHRDSQDYFMESNDANLEPSKYLLANIYVKKEQNYIPINNNAVINSCAIHTDRLVSYCNSNNSQINYICDGQSQMNVPSTSSYITKDDLISQHLYVSTTTETDSDYIAEHKIKRKKKGRMLHLRKTPSAISSSSEEDNCKKDSAEIKSRKKRRRTDWIANSKARNQGKEYVNSKGELQPEKKLKKACRNCRMKCEEKFKEEDRKRIFQEYWNLDADIKVEFISEYVVVQKKARTRRRIKNYKEVDSRRNFTYIYYLPRNGTKEKVCKSIFLNTLSISSHIIKKAIFKPNIRRVASLDRRGSAGK